ncbi:MAG: hypothetical protein DRP96_03685, partial [Candidatus Neomarinimicrobiota bacterium]
MKLSKIFKPSLLKKFLLAFFIVTMIPLIIAEYFTMQRAEDELKSVLNEEYYLIIDQLRRTVDEVYIGNWLSNLTSTTEYIESNPDLSLEIINALLNAKLNQINDLIILTLKLSDSGEQLSTMKNDLVIQLYNQDPDRVARLIQFSDRMEGEKYIIRDPVNLPNSKQLVLPIEVPIQWGDGQRAVLRGVFNLNSIIDFISTEISIGARELYIVNDRDQVVFSNNEYFISGDTLKYPIIKMVRNSLKG